MTKIALAVNGERHEAEVQARQLLVYFLREQLGLTGTNVGCDTSSCGACTVLLDGESVKSCTVLAVQADGSEVTTYGFLRVPGTDEIRLTLRASVEQLRVAEGESVEADVADLVVLPEDGALVLDRDGTKAGFDLALTRAVSDAVGVPVIASGGVGNLDHLADGIQQGGADAVLAASIFHYGEFTVGQAKAHMAARGIPVRI